MEIWEKLAGVKCPTCGGKGKTFNGPAALPVLESDYSPCPCCKGTGRWAWELTVECPPDKAKYLGCPCEAKDVIDAPDYKRQCCLCGYQWPSYQLWIQPHHRADKAHDPLDCQCKGSGRVLKTGDSPLVAAEAVLERVVAVGWKHTNWKATKLHWYGVWQHQMEPHGWANVGADPDRLTAAALALESLAPKS